MIGHHKWREKEMHTEFWWIKIMEAAYLILKHILENNNEIGLMSFVVVMRKTFLDSFVLHVSSLMLK